jgi:hypothetical protein
VKTRTLLLMSVACGMAIVLAGALLLFQLATSDDPEPAAPVGSVVEVGDMSVTVDRIDERDGVVRVAITIGGVADDDPTSGFRLIAAARPVSLTSTTCGPSGDEAGSCVLEFVVGATDGSSRVLFYERGDEQVRWVLS